MPFAHKQDGVDVVYADDINELQDAITAHESDTANPHAVTAAQAGAYTTAQVDSALALRQPLDADLTAISALVAANDDVIQRKSGAWTNRTPAQLKSDLALAKSDVGLGNVDNTSDASKPLSTAATNALALKADASVLSAHTGNVSNPHGVTKTQVGLGNVTNDAQVTLATGQTVTGRKTFLPADYQPQFGPNLAPALSAMTLGGTAVYSAPNIVFAGAGTVSFDIAVVSGQLYEIDPTMSLSGGYSDPTISLGAVSDTSSYWNGGRVALVAATTGTVTVTLTVTNWVGDLTALTVRVATRAAASLVAGTAEMRASGQSTAVGMSAQQSLTTGSGDTAVGASAQRSLTTGSGDTAVGASAQRSLTTGINNTAVGTSAQQSLTTGSGDTAVGMSAQQSLTTGSYDTAVGTSAQQSLTTGSGDTAVGTSAQQSLTTGSYDTAVGMSAQQAPLGNSAYATTTASYQTSVGAESGQSSATQVDGITTVGYRSAAGASNATSIGREARADHDGSVALGYQTVTTRTAQVMAGPRDVEISSASYGLVLTSPDGSKWRQTISNAGVTTWTKL